MATETNLRPTKDVIDALKTKLEALTWTPVTPPAAPAQALFSRVEFFDAEDLLEALRTLVANADRVALVIFAGERWEEPSEGAMVVDRRTQQFVILLSDRVLGNRQNAMLGTATHPGTLAIKDLVYGAVCGVLLANPNGVLVRPVAGDSTLVKDVKTQLPGRSAYSVTIDCVGGYIATDVSPGPIL
jgi:hypothetical protein